MNTNGSFSNVVAMEKMFAICVTIQGVPVAAISGQPNMNYTFTTQPRYYLALTQNKPGVAINDQMSKSKEIVFNNGNFVVNCSIDASNIIVIE